MLSDLTAVIDRSRPKKQVTSALALIQLFSAPLSASCRNGRLPAELGCVVYDTALMLHRISINHSESAVRALRLSFGENASLKEGLTKIQQILKSMLIEVEQVAAEDCTLAKLFFTGFILDPKEAEVRIAIAEASRVKPSVRALPKAAIQWSGQSL